jgi:hypothetical protein
LIPLYQCQPIRSRGAEPGNFVNLNDYALAYRSEPFAANSFAKAPIFAEKLRRGETAGQEIARRKVMGCGKPDDDDGFTALAQLESRRVALESPPQSLGEDAQAETA